ncbi:FMN reductase [Rubneribacter badeniensis]|uniref:FMN reductase n=1 Tax=Rubneribacter badeniensis TaxID=2070688 RepID=A0A2K2U3U6_9ACTN|nr:flavodoxin family protein [Rubneribacter badeniensis]PNV64996.1 FMN reductase [Rubneribacter badeniensis]
MSKKIVVLNGSPRKRGNTSALVEAFAEGAREAGCEVEVFFLEGMDIRACKGCFGGDRTRENPCVQKDDMRAIYDAYRTADALVFASPLYWWTVSAQLKVAVDRLFATAEGEGGLDVPPRECALLMAAEGDGFEESVYWYERLMGHVGWTDKGQVLCPNVADIGDIEGNPALEKARELGKSFGA